MSDRPKVYTVERGDCDYGDHALLGIFATEAAARDWAENHSEYRNAATYSIGEFTLDEASEYMVGLGRCPSCGRDSVSGAAGSEFEGSGFRPFVIYRHLDRLAGTVIDRECRASHRLHVGGTP